MKTFKVLTAGLLALAVAASASAQTKIRIVGSTAFRKATHAAIINILNSPTAAWTGTASNISGVSSAVIAGTLKSGPSAGQSVVFQLAWSGSTGGIQTVAQQSPAITKSFLTTGNTMSAISVDGSYTFTGGTSGATTTESAAADVAMSDTFQGSSIFTGTGYSTLTDQVVGVVVFRWVRGNATGAPSGFSSMTNITTLLAQNLLNGGLPLSQFSGTTADAAFAVEVLGRDEDSGTRLVSFAEPGFGVQSTPLQYQPTIGTGTLAGTITALNPFPANTVLGISYPVGHSGYSSGGTMAGDLNKPVDASLSTYLIGYLGRSDAATVTNGVALTYNGATDTDTNVREGAYTFWSYEHLMYKGTFSGVGKNASDLLATQLHNTDAPASGVNVTTMNVGRNVEGGPVTYGNPYP